VNDRKDEPRNSLLPAPPYAAAGQSPNMGTSGNYAAEGRTNRKPRADLPEAFCDWVIAIATSLQRTYRYSLGCGAPFLNHQRHTTAG